MSIRFEHQEKVRTTPQHAFATIDNLPLTSQWLPPCVSLQKVGAGPNADGDKLRYVYKQGRKQAEMEGEIIARIPDQRLHCKYRDNMFEVSVDLRIAQAADGTLMTHIIEMVPRTWLAKTMSPLIRIGLAKQTREAARNLKILLESADRASEQHVTHRDQ